MSHELGLRVIVHGRVQGVGYRWFAQSRARSLGIVGGVRNLHDDTVEVVAEGAKKLLEDFIKQLRAGPSGADVSSVDAKWSPSAGQYANFEIWSSR